MVGGPPPSIFPPLTRTLPLRLALPRAQPRLQVRVMACSMPLFLFSSQPMYSPAHSRSHHGVLEQIHFGDLILTCGKAKGSTGLKRYETTPRSDRRPFRLQATPLAPEFKAEAPARVLLWSHHKRCPNRLLCQRSPTSQTTLASECYVETS